MPIEPGYEIWRVGPAKSQFISADRVLLVGMHPRSKGSWQPEFALVSWTRDFLHVFSLYTLLKAGIKLPALGQVSLFIAFFLSICSRVFTSIAYSLSFSALSRHVLIGSPHPTCLFFHTNSHSLYHAHREVCNDDIMYIQNINPIANEPLRIKQHIGWLSSHWRKSARFLSLEMILKRSSCETLLDSPVSKPKQPHGLGLKTMSRNEMRYTTKWQAVAN